MTENCSKIKKNNKFSCREELEMLDKSELVDRILQLEAYNSQLKNLIDKSVNNPNDITVKKLCKKFDFSRYTKRRIFLKFYYLGWDYHGFVTQEGILNTIEHHLFNALIKSCCIESRETSNYHRCGRTDKGVSAFSQVISLDIRSKLAADKQENLDQEIPYCKILNRILPTNIRCIAWWPIQNNISARFDCKFRTYKYFFPRGNLNVPAMNAAVKLVIGEHDFRNICKMDVANGVTNFKRKVANAEVFELNQSFQESGFDMCYLEIKSQAFLWHQIRCLMGVLLLVGQNKEKPEVILDLLDIEKVPQKPQYNMAHEVPLNLFHCEYENENWFIDQTELLHTIKILQAEWTLNTIKKLRK
ncbi:tRNA pseudouridine(38/39) synthase isoform X2 [Prorops nasuta]|uniref:tRNA pseudouridine(38/39) synthase isoform X2 n=1 Tax=Prorops nasuta TaxID=863751 RepID=UPI0034CF4A9F